MASICSKSPYSEKRRVPGAVPILSIHFQRLPFEVGVPWTSDGAEKPTCEDCNKLSKHRGRSLSFGRWGASEWQIRHARALSWPMYLSLIKSRRSWPFTTLQPRLAGP